jgi:hypothetical protein
MELNIEVFNKLNFLIDEAKKNKNYELEARFSNKKKILITDEIFNKIFQKLTFSKDNNGYGFNYEMKNILDVILDKSNDSENIRMSINGLDNIKKYWIDQNYDNIEHSFIEKEKIDKIDDDDYNIRYSLSNELPQNNLLEKNMNLLKNNNYDKYYRLKNRYSVKTDDNLFNIDMTVVKSAKGKTFKDSNTLKQTPTHEIEIEFIGKNIETNTEIISRNLLLHCYNILKIIQNNDVIISNKLVSSIRLGYDKLVNNKGISYFIAASPVTIHKENLIKSEEIKNIFERYAVTLKADGFRNFLLVYKSDKESENGKIFLFDNSFNVVDTGLKDTNYTDTLIEGEYVTNNGVKDFWMYDILFNQGNDVRRKHLINAYEDSKNISRLELIDKFLKSSSRTILENFREDNIVKLYKKQYLKSIRNDGSDIFQKVKEIWDKRNFNPFKVDGVIFTPMFEYYPLKGSSWYSLFKWKPPQLNTIDFLIRVSKDDNKNDIKNPYIDSIVRPDGKTETLLKQYKTINLYVGRQKTVYGRNFNKNNNNNSSNNTTNSKKNNFNKIYEKNIPVLFNPFDLDDKNSEVYNLVKIFIEDDEKIYANDPLTGEKEEIYDDIIVEFGYDPSKENGFKWIPYRFRKDKTNLYKNGEEVFGNNEKTANDIFKAINNPVTEEMITTGKIPLLNNKDMSDVKAYYAELDKDTNIGKRERFPYQNFHNHFIKYQQYYLSSPSYIGGFTSGTRGKILDLCCGKGVDINKIKRAKYAEIVGMDIDSKNIKIAQEFYKTIVLSKNIKAFYVRGDSGKLIWPEQACSFTESEKIYTKKFIPTKYYFDTISIQFCFHYFFESEIKFRTMLQNLNDNLKIGGYVVGTCFDGERIYNSIGKESSISGKTFSGETMWKIEKKYSNTKLSFTDKKPNFGKQIDVFVKTIGNVHPEFLVNFSYVDKMMSEYGFTKIMLKPFSDYYDELNNEDKLMDLDEKEIKKDKEAVKNMSIDEKRFSFLSSGFIYKKEKNCSDSLYKKLIELIEKKHKSKKENGVYKVDEDTEHTIEKFEEDQ